MSEPDDVPQADPAGAGPSRPSGLGPMRPQGGRPARGQDQAHLDARRAQVEALELAGCSIRKIAAQVEVSPRTVREDLRVIRRERANDAAGLDLAHARHREAERLEAQRLDLNETLAQLPRGAAADRAAIHRTLVRVAERLARLEGLDAPRRISISGDGSDPGEGVSTPTLVEMLTSYGERSAN